MRELTLKEIQAESLSILKDVHDFCLSHKIRYTLAYGTLIGAIRHKGFIPWDNDIDVAMPRDDYNRFINEYSSSAYELFYHNDGKHDCAIAYARVCEMENTISEHAMWTKEPTGIWIDIFPLDGVPAEMQGFKDYYVSLKKKWLRIQHQRVKYSKLSKQTSVRAIIVTLLLKIKYLNGLFLNRNLDRYINTISSSRKEYPSFWSQLAVMDNGPVEHCADTCLESFMLVPFEKFYFYIMIGYDENLKKVYGDYMKLPPEDQRYIHQSEIKFYWTK